jgi:hypothetical protein
MDGPKWRFFEEIEQPPRFFLIIVDVDAVPMVSCPHGCTRQIHQLESVMDAASEFYYPATCWSISTVA